MAKPKVLTSDQRCSSSPCWYYDNGKKIGCVLAVRRENGTPLGHIVLEGEVDPRDPLGKVQHGVSLLLKREK